MPSVCTRPPCLDTLGARPAVVPGRVHLSCLSSAQGSTTVACWAFVVYEEARHRLEHEERTDDRERVTCSDCRDYMAGGYTF